MKKKSPQLFALILVILLGSVFVNKFLFRKAEKNSISGILNSKTREMNKALPFEVDNNTRAMEARFIPPRTLHYSYLLHNLDLKEFDLKYFQDSTGNQLAQTIKNDPTIKLLRDSAVNFEFQYNDTAGNLIHTFHFGPNEYR